MGNQQARTACRTNILPGQGPAERNDRYLTPKHIVEALGEFDLDPCGAPDHILAHRHRFLGGTCAWRAHALVRHTGPSQTARALPLYALASNTYHCVHLAEPLNQSLSYMRALLFDYP